jgi:hypothetical protein
LEGKYRVNWVLCFPLQVTIDYIILSLSHAHTIRQLPKGKDVLYLQDARHDQHSKRGNQIAIKDEGENKSAKVIILEQIHDHAATQHTSLPMDDALA